MRYRLLLLTQAAFAASYVVFLGASAVSVAVGTVVMVIGAIVYTLAELIGGPVLSATAAEAAPDHLRGRYLSMTQLAWNLSSTVTPVGFAWLLERGPEPLWFVMLVVAAVFAVISWRVGAVLPQAAERVTNRAAEPAAAPSA